MTIMVVDVEVVTALMVAIVAIEAKDALVVAAV